MSDEVGRLDEPADSLATYSVSVRNLCEFAAKVGDLDLRFTPSPSAQQGREGHLLVASRRPAGHEAEVELASTYRNLRVRGRADGYSAARNELEEAKTFRGSVEAVAPNHSALHWAQLRVYGWMMCQSRDLPRITLTLVYFDVLDQTEHPFSEELAAFDLQVFFEAMCERFLGWAHGEMLHRQRRDAVLLALQFPQLPFRAGQRELAAGVYRACVQSRPLLVQAPTGIGKTMGTLFPTLRAMPERGVDKIYFLTAKTPGRQIALDALQKLRTPNAGTGSNVRVLEMVARDKSCEHPDKACHGQSCVLARGFYDRLPAARLNAAQQGWLDQHSLRAVALAHGVCPYYLSHEMVRWSDVVVGDYNYYFDRSAMLYALTVDNHWRVSVLVDEAHNLYSRACSMYSTELGQAQTEAVQSQVPSVLRPHVAELLNLWKIILPATMDKDSLACWHLLDEVPEVWLRGLQRFNRAVGEYLNAHPAEVPGAWLLFYFKTLGFASLAEGFGDHSMCELALRPDALDIPASTGVECLQGDLIGNDHLAGARKTCDATITLRNIVPAQFLRTRIQAADSMVLFSATLHPLDYYTNLLGLPHSTQILDIASPFESDRLLVLIKPVSTRRDDRAASLDELVDTMVTQFHHEPGNYLAFFSSFDYLEMALRRMVQRYPNLPVWSQQRQMAEARRQEFLQQFDSAGQGIGFAVLGGVFGEGVDLPGKRLIGAFIATLGLPQFDVVNRAICERMQARFGRGHDYTFVLPGLQKVVQAAGRVIRTQDDRGTVLLLDDRYRELRYRSLLPRGWNVRSP